MPTCTFITYICIKNLAEVRKVFEIGHLEARKTQNCPIIPWFHDLIIFGSHFDSWHQFSINKILLNLKLFSYLRAKKYNRFCSIYMLFSRSLLWKLSTHPTLIIAKTKRNVPLVNVSWYECWKTCLNRALTTRIHKRNIFVST